MQVLSAEAFCRYQTRPNLCVTDQILSQFQFLEITRLRSLSDLRLPSVRQPGLDTLRVFVRQQPAQQKRN